MADVPSLEAPLTSAGGTSLIELIQFRSEFKRATPASHFEYVTVTFTSANTDQDIKVTLMPGDPENIEYLVVRKDRACDIYHDQSGTRRAWVAGRITLKSTIASAKVRLLLFIPRTV